MASSSLVGTPEVLGEEEAKWLVYFNTKRMERKLKALYLDPPIREQTYGLFSFVPSPGAKPDDKGEFGLIKLRGGYPTPDDAKMAARKLILETDQIFPIIQVPMGQAFPLTPDLLNHIGSEFFKDISEEEYHNECKIQHESDIKKRALLNEKENAEVTDLRKCLNNIRVTIACAMNGIGNLKTFDSRTKELLALLPTVGLETEDGCLIKACVNACQKEDEEAGLNTAYQFDKIRAKIGLLPKVQRDLQEICDAIHKLDQDVLDWTVV